MQFQRFALHLSLQRHAGDAPSLAGGRRGGSSYHIWNFPRAETELHTEFIVRIITY